MYTNPHIDWALVALICFSVLFLILLVYLRREDRREGYPLENEQGKRESPGGILFMGEPKTYVMADGSTLTVPNGGRDLRPVPGRFAARSPGSPLIPTGDPLGACIGPGSYAERAKTPLMDAHGKPLIVPLRLLPNFRMAKFGTNPLGLPVEGLDGAVAGKVSDVWVDHGEAMVRYLEVALTGGDHVLLPITHCMVSPRRVVVDAIKGDQFAGVPRLARDDQITLDEEERVCAYYGSGYFYATKERTEPLL